MGPALTAIINQSPPLAQPCIYSAGERPEERARTARRTRARLLALFAPRTHTHTHWHTLAHSRTPQALPRTRALPLVTGPRPSTDKQISSWLQGH